MDRWMGSALEGPAERKPLPESVQRIAIDDDALWADLCDAEEWVPLRAATVQLAHAVQSPRSLLASSVDSGAWNMAHLAVIFELERLHYLLMARQLSDRIQDISWEEPLSSLLHGLDVAAASAMETGRLLAVEMNDEIEAPEDQFAGDRFESEEVEEMPEWGRGYAYVLFRRFLAEVHAALDLLDAVCREADEEEA